MMMWFWLHAFGFFLWIREEGERFTVATAADGISLSDVENKKLFCAKFQACCRVVDAVIQSFWKSHDAWESGGGKHSSTGNVE